MMAKLKQFVPLLVLLILGEANGKEKVEIGREGKLFSIFSVVTFPNDQCTGVSTTSSTEVKGTCYSSTECRSRSGTADGNCASGFGVCCTFVTSTCGSTVTNNCTYIQNPSYPSTYSTTGSCAYSIAPVSAGICQLRLDLDNFDITEVLTGATAGACTDSFVVTASSSRQYQDLCGTLSGQHVYYETARSTSSQTLSFTIATGGTWRIKVSQIECWSTSKPPTDCYQYFTGDSGNVQSLNWPTVALDHLDYSICIRQESGYCAIQWNTSASPSPDTFTLGDIAMGLAGGANTSTSKALIFIPGSMHISYAGSNLSDDATAITADRDLTDAAVLAVGVPFILHFSVPTGDSDSTGFSLDWRQVPCGGFRQE